MPRLRKGRSLWLARRLPSFHAPTLRGAIDADVVIVGGGLTGATIAWTFAEAGFRVAVLERGRVARASTAANSALLMQEPDEDLTALAKRYGPAAARRIWQLGRESTRDFIRLLRRLRIACDLHECDSIYYAARADAVDRLRREHRRRRQAGFGGRWLDAGAIRTHGNAQLDPVRACIGLMAAARSAGVQVFEHSAVRRVVRIRGGVRAMTAHGSVDASRVIVATGYATPQFKPLAGRFRMKHTYVMATERLQRRSGAARLYPAESPKARRGMSNGIPLGDAMVWDTNRPYHYARWTHDRRLILGGGDRPAGRRKNRARAFREGIEDLRRHLTSLVPALADVKIEFEWEGLFAMTPDGLPYVGPHRRYPRHLFALGYGGNGMTFGFLAARLLLDWFRGAQSNDLRLFAFNRKP